MYESFYGLRARPFLIVPDPELLFWSEAHSMAFTTLRYGVMTRAPITLITGEIGAGKTTLLRRMLCEIPDDIEVGLVSNMQANRGDLLSWVLLSLGEPLREESYVALFQRLQDRLISSYARGRRVVLVFDEAQNLDIETLEELRMLSNINSDKDEILQIILVGQPQLRGLINRPELVQFRQRISADYHLTALTPEEVDAYIQHRLEFVGAAWRIFPRETTAMIAAASRGVPRLVNILSDLCLVYGYASESKVILPDLLRDFLQSARERGLYQQFSLPEETPDLAPHI